MTTRKNVVDPERRSKELKGIGHTLLEEADKLSKKKPDLPASDLMVERVNWLIGAVKNLISDDDFLNDQVKVFVPAGENPEMRDVVLVLSEVTNAVDRLRARNSWHY